MNNRNEKFDEYFWESQLRHEDIKLHSCMQAIPAVIDLPGEDEMLMKRIPKQPEYSVFDSVNNQEFLSDDLFDMEKILNSENAKHSEWFKVYSDIDKLMRSWTIYYVEETDNYDIFRILCLYARLLGLAVNIINYTNEGQINLFKAVSKRMISKLNKILSLIESGDFDSIIATNQTLGLFRIRSLVLNLLFAAKNKKSE
jgi:hypothetical protein